MSRFKVGDRVKLNGHNSGAPIAKGTVVTISSLDGERYFCYEYNAIKWWGDLIEFELVVPKPLTIENLSDLLPKTLPTESKARKDVPLFTGLLQYFPAALAEVAKVSKVGNDKHNAEQPLHHSRDKSNDHADCIIRHLIDMSEDRGKGIGRDEDGIPQVAYIAWRALALAQQWLEDNEHKPKAPAAK